MNFFKKKKYFDGTVTSGFVSLYTGKTIVNIASALLGIFVPIFLYELFDHNVAWVVGYFGIGSLVYVLFLHPGMQAVNVFGFRNSLRLSVIFGAVYYIGFFFWDASNMWYVFPITIILLSLYRIAYWIPYHVNFAKFTNKKNRGRQVSAVYATQLLIGIFVPAIAGYLITRYGYDILFILAIFLFLTSGIPYITLPHTKEKYEYTAKQYLSELFSKKRRSVLLASLADGAETFVGLIIWPIFIFTLLDGNYLHVGSLSTLIIGSTVILQLAIGSFIDGSIKKERMLRLGSFFYSLGWIAKIFIVTATEIFLAGIYHNMTKIFTRTPFDALNYEIAVDEGHYIDEFTVLKETALHMGRVLMAGVVFVLTLTLPLQTVFIFAAVASLLLNFVWATKKEFHDHRTNFSTNG